MARKGAWCAIAVALAVLAAGCGEQDPGTAEAQTDPASRLAAAEIRADGAEDRRIGHDLRDYLDRNCALPGYEERITDADREAPGAAYWLRILEGEVAMCGNIVAIEVEDTRVTLRSDIEDEAELREAAGDAFCNLVQGADVADFTPGHELADAAGETIEVCPGREG